MSDWQPIATAPKDGTYVMLWGKWEDEAHGFGPWPAYWDRGDEEWLSSVTPQEHLGAGVFKCLYIQEPTHWMPLPQPPQESE